MLVRSPFSTSFLPTDCAAVVVDMIGDLDTTAAQSFAATAERVAGAPDGRIVLRLRHAALIDAGGITVLARSLSDLRRRGLDVEVVAESKRVRTALHAARIASRTPVPADGTACERHVMIVRNTDPARDCA